jgi:hypothetical protein
MGPLLHRLLASEKTRELRVAAEAERLARRPAIPKRERPVDLSVTIRHAFPDDARALSRLATLDSSAPPPDPVLVAEVDGRLRAALSLSDGTIVADPFHPSQALIELLSARARQLASAREFAVGPGRVSAAWTVIQRRLQIRA